MPFDNLPYADRLKQAGFIPANHIDATYFPVERVALQTADGIRLPTHMAVLRQDTKQILGVHTDSYQIVTHDDVHQAFMEALVDSRLDLTQMVVGKDTSHDGARMFLQIVLPAHGVKVRNDDEVAMRIVCFNSYDGTTSVKFRVGGYRFVCANTAVHGSDIAAASKKHTSAFDISVMAEGLVRAAEAYVEEAKRFKLWADVDVGDLGALNVMKSIPGSNPAMREVMQERWMTSEDRTLWGLYNVLTAWATHSEGRGKNAIASRMAREERIAKVIDAPAWKLLEAA